jgi:RNA polymerase sigma-70 factor (ECF subfamily)
LQDIFLRLYRFIHNVDTTRPIEPWLYRMTANLAYTWIKRHKRWGISWEDLAEKISFGRRPTPAAVIETQDDWHQIRQAVLSLPFSQRVVVVMYYINDLPLHEIAEILDVPEGTVKSRLHYGRRALREHLAKLQGELLSELLYDFT